MRTLQWFVNKAAAQRMDWVKSKSQGTQSTCLWLFHRYLKSWWVQSTAHAHSLSRGATEGMWQPVLREFDKISFQYFRFELVNTLSKKSRLVEQWPSSFCAAWPNDQLIYFPAQRIFSRIIITVVPTWQEDTICVSGESFYSLCANNVFWHIFTWCWLKDILSGALKECWRLMIIRSLGCHGLCLCQLKATVDNLCFVCQEHSQRTVHSACLLANHIEKISQG